MTISRRPARRGSVVRERLGGIAASVLCVTLLAMLGCKSGDKSGASNAELTARGGGGGVSNGDSASAPIPAYGAPVLPTPIPTIRDTPATEAELTLAQAKATANPRDAHVQLEYARALASVFLFGPADAAVNAAMRVADKDNGMLMAELHGIRAECRFARGAFRGAAEDAWQAYKLDSTLARAQAFMRLDPAADYWVEGDGTEQDWIAKRIIAGEDVELANAYLRYARFGGFVSAFEGSQHWGWRRYGKRRRIKETYEVSQFAATRPGASSAVLSALYAAHDAVFNKLIEDGMSSWKGNDFDLSARALNWSGQRLGEVLAASADPQLCFEGAVQAFMNAARLGAIELAARLLTRVVDGTLSVVGRDTEESRATCESFWIALAAQRELSVYREERVTAFAPYWAEDVRDARAALRTAHHISCPRPTALTGVTEASLASLDEIRKLHYADPGEPTGEGHGPHNTRYIALRHQVANDLHRAVSSGLFSPRVSIAEVEASKSVELRRAGHAAWSFLNTHVRPLMRASEATSRFLVLGLTVEESSDSDFEALALRSQSWFPFGENQWLNITRGGPDVSEVMGLLSHVGMATKDSPNGPGILIKPDLPETPDNVLYWLGARPSDVVAAINGKPVSNLFEAAQVVVGELVRSPNENLRRFEAECVRGGERFRVVVLTFDPDKR